MGIVNDLKKIFFGASSLAKSAADSTTEFIKEEGGEILAKGKDLATEAGQTVLEKTSDLKDAVVDNSGGILDSAKDKFSEVSESITRNDFVQTAKDKLSSVTDEISQNEFVQSAKEKISEVADGLAENPIVQSAQETAENLGAKVIEKGGDIAEKFGEVSENLGTKIIDGGGDAIEKSLDISEGVGEKLLEAKDRVSDRVGEISGQISDKLDETMKKAQDWEAAEAQKPPKKEFAEDTLDADGSLLEGTDDFFSKAEKFASGDYDAVHDGKVRVDDTRVELPTETKPADIAGFEDLDGDGNPLVDDADIVE